ncbi:Regulator of G-protein signaling 3 [Bienertia sinuspersici]
MAQCAVTLRFWNGGVFKKGAKGLQYIGGQEDLAKESGGYSKIDSVHFLLPKQSLDKDLVDGHEVHPINPPKKQGPLQKNTPAQKSSPPKEQNPPKKQGPLQKNTLAQKSSPPKEQNPPKKQGPLQKNTPTQKSSPPKEQTPPQKKIPTKAKTPQKQHLKPTKDSTPVRTSPRFNKSTTVTEEETAVNCTLEKRKGSKNFMNQLPQLNPNQRTTMTGLMTGQIVQSLIKSYVLEVEEEEFRGDYDGLDDDEVFADSTDDELVEARNNMKGINTKISHVAPEGEGEPVSDYEESEDDIHTPEESENEDGQMRAKRSRAILVSRNTDWKSFVWKAGHRFTSREAFRDAVAHFAIAQGRNLSFSTNNRKRQQRMEVKCLTGVHLGYMAVGIQEEHVLW